MRFLRWYWRTTTQVFREREYRKGFKGYFLDSVGLALDYIKAVFMSVALFMLFVFLWLFLPDSVRELITNVSMMSWAYIVAMATGIWAYIQPIFNWLASLDWEGGFVKVDNFMHGSRVILLRFIIALFVTVFLLTLILSIIDFIRIIVFKAEWQKEKRAVLVGCFILSALGGYYATTSSYGNSAVNYISSSFLFVQHTPPTK